MFRHVRADDEYGEGSQADRYLSLKENAERGIARLQSQAVFRHHLPGFQIEAYELDKDHLTEGFFNRGRRECSRLLGRAFTDEVEGMVI